MAEGLGEFERQLIRLTAEWAAQYQVARSNRGDSVALADQYEAEMLGSIGSWENHYEHG